MPSMRLSASGAVENTSDVVPQDVSIIDAALANNIASVVPVWVQNGTYAPGDIRVLDGAFWRYVGAEPTKALDANWAPGRAYSLWARYWNPDFIPTWFQPFGSVDAFPLGQPVYHQITDRIWISTHPANVWEPNTIANTWVLREDQPPLEPETNEWVQPVPGDPDFPVYNTGDRAIYNGKTWKSTINDNVWPPGTGSLWVEV